jgi:putative transposase
MRFAFIAARKAEFPISVMCRVFNVQPSGFYSWQKRPPPKRKKDDDRLKVHVRASHKASRKTYGSPRVYKDMKAEGFKVGKKRVARLMREDGLSGTPPKKFTRTTDSAHNKPIAPNILNRKFSAVEKPNTVWASDITYIWTAVGWLYLAVVIDLFSRRVVGYAIDDHMRAGLVTDALILALESRDASDGLLHHSDRGSQYAGDEMLKIAKDHGITLSMSRRGNCWDNAVAESFFATLKKELIHRQSWLSKSQTIAAVSDYIADFYNRRRRHSAIGFISPAEYERLTMMAEAA